MPRDIKPKSDCQKRILLDQLHRILCGYGKTPGYEAIVVVVDCDDRNCVDFLNELKGVARKSNAPSQTIFRLAIEEIEAWYLGDHAALQKAYPHAKSQVLKRYEQDTVCGTWELLADAVVKGGSTKIKTDGWPRPGQDKHDWAERIGPFMSLVDNESPSFKKLRDGLRQLVAADSHLASGTAT